MIQKPINYEEVTTFTQRPQLPPGGYVLRILAVKQEQTEKSKQLAVRFDIVDGDHMGFFEKDFNLQSEENRKWKGTYRVPLVYDEEWKVKRLKTFMTCVEKSNPGFEYDWSGEEEPQLKGKYFGGIFNRKEWEYNGKTGFATQLKYPSTVESIRSGEYKVPADDILKSDDAPAEDAPAGFSTLQDDDIPF